MTTGTTTNASTADATKRAVSASNSHMVRQLLRAGCTPREAWNLYAVAVGLRPVTTGWRPVEIERLKFLRHLVETGRLSS